MSAEINLKDILFYIVIVLKDTILFLRSLFFCLGAVSLFYRIFCAGHETVKNISLPKMGQLQVVKVLRLCCPVGSVRVSVLILLVLQLKFTASV